MHFQYHAHSECGVDCKGAQSLLVTSIIHSHFSASGCVVECRICNREVAGSNLGMGYFASRSTQPSIPPGSVNEY